MIEAIIFDMDGLLVDSEPCWDAARREMAAEVGVHDWNREDHHACMGVSTREWAEYMIRRMHLDLPWQEVADRIVANMQAIYAAGIPYLPGAVEAVALAAAHYPTGLASGSERTLIDMVVADAPMRGKFRAVVCTDAMPRGKPAPDVYLEAARLLGVLPERCVCLEDSGNGILAGVAAGMRVIAVPDPRFPPNPAALAQAAVVLPSLSEFNLEAVRGL